MEKVYLCANCFEDVKHCSPYLKSVEVVIVSMENCDNFCDDGVLNVEKREHDES